MYNMPTFRNHVSVPSSKAGSRLCGVRKGEAIYTVDGNGTGAGQANWKVMHKWGRFRMGGRVWWGRYKDVGQVADRLLHEVCLSRFSLSMCKRGFQAVLRIRPSSLFMLLGCISISMASLMRRSE